MNPLHMRVILKNGREKSLLRRHPWVFSGSLASTIGNPDCGDTVRVESAAGEFLGWGAFSPNSQIRVRIWSWDEQTVIDKSFIHHKIEQAILMRQRLFLSSVSDACRLVNGESDGFPGLIVDRYQDWLVVQLLSCGAERWRQEILDALIAIVHPKGIYERSDADIRALEGLVPRTGLLWGEAPPDLVTIDLHGLSYFIDLYRGHKTGYYLDQRENHTVIRDLSAGRDILDCFSYTGSFSIEALSAGAASVTAVDSSEEALALAEKNIEINQLDLQRFSKIQGDVFQVLRKMRDARRSFDLIILDPPKFAPTAAQVQKASRGYKDINLLALKLLKPQGVLITFSCSGGISPELFQKILAASALDVCVDAKIIMQLHQAWDHSISLAFPEGQYLKGLVIQNS